MDCQGREGERDIRVLIAGVGHLQRKSKPMRRRSLVEHGLQGVDRLAGAVRKMKPLGVAERGRSLALRASWLRTGNGRLFIGAASPPDRRWRLEIRPVARGALRSRQRDGKQPPGWIEPQGIQRPLLIQQLMPML